MSFGIPIGIGSVGWKADKSASTFGFGCNRARAVRRLSPTLVAIGPIFAYGKTRESQSVKPANQSLFRSIKPALHAAWAPWPGIFCHANQVAISAFTRLN